MPAQRRSYRLRSKVPHPYPRCTQKLLDAFKGREGNLVKSVLSVIHYMRKQHLNLPIFLWAISWNIRELTSHPVVAAERAALMKSKELPEILAHWRRPPRKHNTRIRTKATYETMNKFTLETVHELVDKEMGVLANVMASPPDDLSEESLLGTHWEDLISEVNTHAPTTWSLFHHAVCGSMEAKLKNYKTVCNHHLNSFMTITD